MTKVHLVSVFPASPHGGNPAPIVVDAEGMSDDEMRAVARRYGHESGFVLPAPAGSNCDVAFRFWVPNHEMEMCGHATIGAAWLLGHLGRLSRDDLAIWTLSGRVDAHVSSRESNDPQVEISQPAGRLEPLSAQEEADILSVLGITADERTPLPVWNACTSRVKTLIPLKSTVILDGLKPDFSRVEALCENIGSTGLYPFAVADEARTFDARQFPKSSGYEEDAATGIAAAALSFGLRKDGLVQADDRPIIIRQGRAMGRPSRIALRFRLNGAGAVDGCWLGGPVRLEELPKTAKI